MTLLVEWKTGWCHGFRLCAMGQYAATEEKLPLPAEPDKDRATNWVQMGEGNPR